MHRVFALTVSVLIVLCHPLSAAPKWTRLQTANFTFVGDASDSEIRHTAQKLEQFRYALAQIVPGAAKPSPVPTVVVVFGQDRAFDPYKPRFQGRPIAVAGYFQSGPDVNYIALTVEGNPYHTIFHEYTHSVANNAVRQLPIWINEGLAEVYATFEGSGDGRSGTIGIAPLEHVQLLRGSTLMPLRELFAVTHDSPVYNEGSRRGVLYAQSWALVHYLMLGSPARTGQLRQYITAITTGSDADDAFRMTFGDAHQLEDELSAYIHRFTFPALKIVFAESARTAIPAHGDPILEADAQGYLGGLLLQTGRVDEARQLLESTLKQQPESIRASVNLALLHARENRLADAVALLHRAATRAPDDGTVQTAYGRTLVMQMQERLTDREALVPMIVEARGALTRAVQSMPNASEPAAMLGYVELLDGTDLARAASLLDTAVRLSPEREQYRLMAGDAWGRQGNTESAAGYFGPLIASGSTDAVRNEARAALGAIADRRRGANPAPQLPSAPASTGTASSGRSGVRILEQDGTVTSVTSTQTSTPGTAIPFLRLLQPGETRVVGTLRAIECRQNRIVFRVDAARPMAFTATKFDNVDFISYDPKAPPSVSCGNVTPLARVAATYRPQAASTDAGMDGEMVAVELLPEGFTPRD